MYSCLACVAAAMGCGSAALLAAKDKESALLLAAKDAAKEKDALLAAARERELLVAASAEKDRELLLQKLAAAGNEQRQLRANAAKTKKMLLLLHQRKSPGRWGVPTPVLQSDSDAVLYSAPQQQQQLLVQQQAEQLAANQTQMQAIQQQMQQLMQQQARPPRVAPQPPRLLLSAPGGNARAAPPLRSDRSLASGTALATSTGPVALAPVPSASKTTEATAAAGPRVVKARETAQASRNPPAMIEREHAAMAVPGPRAAGSSSRAKDEPTAGNVVEHDFFLSHYQATGGDQVMTLELRLSGMGFSCWLDQKAESITKEAMQAGVEASTVFLLFLSQGVLQRPFVLFEVRTALAKRKTLMLMHETDGRHGAFDFGAETNLLPADVAELLETHESIPWRRRRFEQDAILVELIKKSGAESRSSQGGTGSTSAAAPADRRSSTGAGLGTTSLSNAGLAIVPDSVPLLPEAFNGRPNDTKQVLDVLLDRSDATAEKDGTGRKRPCKVSAHGMGGLGKTTLAASIVREVQVRSRFDRIGFVSAGQEPAMLEEQRMLYAQLCGSAMRIKPSATASSQREELLNASSGKKWLAVLDDVWVPHHERMLNPFDKSGMATSGAKVLVTTRFAKLLPGYVDVALGLLDVDEAAGLVLDTAELEPTESAVLAAKKIAKLCGRLPLFLGLAGRLVFEYGSEGSWETEIVAMLQEDRSSVLASGVGGDGVTGSHIVGGSLASLKDAEAKELFTLLAVAPEDVPIPLAAVELFWCAHKTMTPPLGRLGMMKLRGRVFSLLDRNLLLGETTSGVYMHDVVREHARAAAGGDDGLRAPQRAVVQLLIAAAPVGGWNPGNNVEDAFAEYVILSLRHHMSEAIEQDVPKDALALRWLETEATVVANDFVARQACNAVGAAALVGLAEAAEASCVDRESDQAVDTQSRAAAHYYMCAMATDEMTPSGSKDSDPEGHGRYAGLAIMASDCYRRVAKSTTWLRTRELGLVQAVASGSAWGSDQFRVATERLAQLVSHGVETPAKLLDRLQLGIAIMLSSFVHSPGKTNVGKHLEEGSCRQTAVLFNNALGLQAAIGVMLPPESPQQVALFSGYGILFCANYPSGLWTFPDVGDVGVYLTAQLTANVYDRYEYETHAPLCAKLPQTHSIISFSGVDVCLARHAQVSLALQWTRKKVDMLEDASILERIRPGQSFMLMIDSMVPPIVMAVEGSFALGARALEATGLTFDGAEAVLAKRQKPMGTSWSATEPFPMTCAITGYFIDAAKLKHGLCCLSAARGAVDITAFSEWLPAPGTFGCVRDPASPLHGAYDAHLGCVYTSLVNSPEPMAHASLSKYADAITAAQISAERFPFNVPQLVVHRGVVAQCLAALGDTAGAGRAFDRAIADAYDHRLYFVSAVLAADYIATGLGGREQLVSGAIGKALAAMPDADLDGVTAKVLSPRVPGVDAGVALAAHWN